MKIQKRGSRFIDIENKKFGCLTALSIDSDNTGPHREIRWFCKCSCNDKIMAYSVPAYKLRNGHTTSCGCAQIEAARLASYNPDPQDVSFRAKYRSYRSSAKKRKINFDLTFDFFKIICGQKCFYCNSEPSNTISVYLNKDGLINGRGKKTTLTHALTTKITINGIDRMDSTKGYDVENSVPCCFQCNAAKSDFSKTDFLNWIKKVYEFNFKP